MQDFFLCRCESSSCDNSFVALVVCTGEWLIAAGWMLFLICNNYAQLDRIKWTYCNGVDLPVALVCSGGLLLVGRILLVECRPVSEEARVHSEDLLGQ